MMREISSSCSVLHSFHERGSCKLIFRCVIRLVTLWFWRCKFNNYNWHNQLLLLILTFISILTVVLSVNLCQRIARTTRSFFVVNRLHWLHRLSCNEETTNNTNNTNYNHQMNQMNQTLHCASHPVHLVHQVIKTKNFVLFVLFVVKTKKSV